VERSLLAVLTPHIDPWLGPNSYVFRPGLGVRDAVLELARRRDEGYDWVLRTDIDDCFPTIDLEQVRRRLAVLVHDEGFLAVVDVLLTRFAVRPGQHETNGRRAVYRRAHLSHRYWPTWCSNISITGCPRPSSRWCVSPMTSRYQ
jgi:retron-type reverse transcriptase